MNPDPRTDNPRHGESSPHPLHIIIIGAGIAGLTAAIALRQQQHHVTLLEKSSFHREAGAATYVGPNAAGLLLRLGWDPAASRANKCCGITSIDGFTGTLRVKRTWEDAGQRWQGEQGESRPWLLCHRVDLHHELKRMALDPDAIGPVPELLLGIQVAHVDVHRAEVRLEDGRLFSGDVVIGADGKGAVSRGYVAPAAELRSTGKICYRWMLSREVLRADEDTRRFVEDDGVFVELAVNNKRLILYPCRENTMINLAATVPESALDMTRKGWSTKGTKPSMLKSLDCLFPAAKKLLYHAEEDIGVWTFHDMDPLDTWVNDRLLVIGDAAHPFLPHLGQGAAQAIEDAVSLATLLAPDTCSKDVPELLKLCEDIRKDHAHHVQAETRLCGRDDDEERPSPSEKLAMMDACFRHDEWKNTMERLREWKAQRA